MTFMDITKYVKAVARIVNDELTRENIAVANAAQKSGIPRTTLMRRLDHPLHPIKDANHWEYSKERVLEFFAANLHRSTGEYATTAQEGEG